jgi:hypothetical protein
MARMSCNSDLDKRSNYSKRDSGREHEMTRRKVSDRRKNLKTTRADGFVLPFILRLH